MIKDIKRDNMRIDSRRESLWYFDREIWLTGNQFKLFRCLFKNYGEMVGLFELRRLFFDDVLSEANNSLKVYTYQLKKIFDKEGLPLEIRARRGLGLELRHTGK